MWPFRIQITQPAFYMKMHQNPTLSSSHLMEKFSEIDSGWKLYIENCEA